MNYLKIFVKPIGGGVGEEVGAYRARDGDGINFFRATYQLVYYDPVYAQAIRITRPCFQGTRYLVRMKDASKMEIKVFDYPTFETEGEVYSDKEKLRILRDCLWDLQTAGLNEYQLSKVKEALGKAGKVYENWEKP